MNKRRTRRRYSGDLKRRVVVDTYVAGVSIAYVVRRHGLNNNRVFAWRKDQGSESTGTKTYAREYRLPRDRRYRKRPHMLRVGHHGASRYLR